MSDAVEHVRIPDLNPSVDDIQVQGYAPLASLMSKHSELAIFSSFGELNYLNIVYLQAELVYLQKKLKRLVAQDHHAGLIGKMNRTPDERKLKYETDWYALAFSEELDRDSLQWRTVLEIRGKLKEYNKALQSAFKSTSLPRPSALDLEFLQRWLERPALGGNALDGDDYNLWSTTPLDDLVALRAKAPDNPLSRFLRGPFINFYHNLIRPCRKHVTQYISKFLRAFARRRRRKSSIDENDIPHQDSFVSSRSTPSLSHCDKAEAVDKEAQRYVSEEEYTHYQDEALLRAATIIATILTSVIPMASILILYSIDSLSTRLYVSSVFTVIFSCAVKLVTKARMSELFAATSAFAAVQVMFLGNTSGYIGK